MARVEKSTPQKGDDDMVKMRGELKKVSKRVNRHHPIFSCFLIFAAVVVIIFLALVWLLASTGLVRVPGISALAYNKPVPLHVVEPGESLENKIQTELESLVTQRLQAGGGQINNRDITVSLSEESFTSSLQTIIASQADDFFEAQTTQIAIDPDDGIEIYIPVLDNPLETALLIDLKVVVEEDKLVVQIQKIQIGSLKVPVSLFGGRLEKTFLNPLLQKLSNEIGRFGKITNIRFFKGFITLDGQLLVEVERLQ